MATKWATRLAFALLVPACHAGVTDSPVVDFDDLCAVEHADLEFAADGPATQSLQMHRVSLSQRARLLETGPAAFLGHIKLEPVLSDKRFLGWRIGAVPDPGWGIAAGDVVIAVNGIKVVKPAQFDALWRSLATAQEVVVEGLRGQDGFVVRFVFEPSPEETLP